MSKPAIAVIAALALVVPAGCGGGGGGSGGKSAKTPGVSFTAPAEGELLRGGTVNASLAVRHFTLDAADLGKKDTAGKGHVGFSLDGGKYDQPKYSGPNGKRAVQLGVEGRYSPAVIPGITYRNVPPGPHILRVDLLTNEGRRIGPWAAVRLRMR